MRASARSNCLLLSVLSPPLFGVFNLTFTKLLHRPGRVKEQLAVPPSYPRAVPRHYATSGTRSATWKCAWQSDCGAQYSQPKSTAQVGGRSLGGGNLRDCGGKQVTPWSHRRRLRTVENVEAPKHPHKGSQRHDFDSTPTRPEGQTGTRDITRDSRDSHATRSTALLMGSWKLHSRCSMEAAPRPALCRGRIVLCVRYVLRMASGAYRKAECAIVPGYGRVAQLQLGS